MPTEKIQNSDSNIGVPWCCRVLCPIVPIAETLREISSDGETNITFSSRLDFFIIFEIVAASVLELAALLRRYHLRPLVRLVHDNFVQMPFFS